MQPSDLEATVDRQSWEWLFDVPRRLNVAVEVIDDRHMPVFPAGSAPAATAIRRMLTTGDPPLISAISDVLRTSKPTPVAANGLLALCFGLSQGGVLVLAREVPESDSAAECRQDLELIGSWLTGAIEANLAKPPSAINVEPYRMASLQRILRDAMSRGSVRTVLGAFVEALGVWDDVVVHGYAADASGDFFLYVSPVGAASPFPAELDDTLVPRHSRMVRVSRAEIDRLGLASTTGDVLILRLLGGAGTDFLLVFSGTIDDHEQVRLTLYADMLREALNDVLARTRDHVKMGAMRPQLPPNERLEEAAQMVLGRLAATVGASRAALVVTEAAGAQLLTAGDADLLSAPHGHVAPNRLVVTSADPGSTMEIVVAREQLPFTSFERESLEAGVRVLHPWVQEALQPSKDTERRGRFRPVDVLFDRLAAEAVDAGQHASVIVVAVPATDLRPGLMQTWLGKTRAQLRGGDFAGILSDTEIAVLLCDASTEHAALVSARLKQLVVAGESAGQPAIGMTTRSPESPFEGSLVARARAGAAVVR
jgi:hypothetical protein